MGGKLYLLISQLPDERQVMSFNISTDQMRNKLCLLISPYPNLPNGRQRMPLHFFVKNCTF